MTSVALRSVLLRRYAQRSLKASRIQPRLLSTSHLSASRSLLRQQRARWAAMPAYPSQTRVALLPKQQARLNSSTSSTSRSGSSATATSSRGQRRGKFFRRMKRRLLFYGLIFGAWLYFVDADFVTYFDHIYRTQYKKEEDIFQGQTFWIVGASSGIGEFLTYQVAQNKANKIIISSRRQQELERVKATCKLVNPQCQVIVEPLDIMQFSSNSAVENDAYLTNMLASHGDVDVLVLNSGVTNASRAVKTDVDVLRQMTEINVLSPGAMAVSMIRAWRASNHINTAIKSNKNKKGHSIVVTSSLAGKIGGPGRSAYCMTKHALNGYFESLRTEHINDNVNVTIVCPGPVERSASATKAIGADGSRIERGIGNRGSDLRLDRCADLYCTAIKYELPEVWIANQPNLLVAYGRQYLSGLMKYAVKYIAPFWTSDKV